jgi:hypothetical protein
MPSCPAGAAAIPLHTLVPEKRRIGVDDAENGAFRPRFRFEDQAVAAAPFLFRTAKNRVW